MMAQVDAKFRHPARRGKARDNYPGIAHPERLALAIDRPLRRRNPRTDRAMWLIAIGFWAAFWAAFAAAALAIVVRDAWR